MSERNFPPRLHWCRQDAGPRSKVWDGTVLAQSRELRKSHALWSVLFIVTVAVLAFGEAGCGSGVTTTSVSKVVTSSSTTATSVQRGVTGPDSWRMSGHDSERTSRSSAVGSSSGTLKWTYQTEDSETNGYIVASPVIDSDGTTYVAGMIGTTEGGTLYALAPDGTLKWSYKGHFDSSPVLGADGTIYIAGSLGGIFALGRDGKLKWSAHAGDISSQLVIAPDGTIYAAGSKLFAFNSKGTVKWSFDYSSGTTNGGAIPNVASPPALGPDGTVYVQAGPSLLAISPNGSLKWSHGFEADTQVALAVASDGTLYMGQTNGMLSAIDSSGHLKWTFAAGDPRLSVAIGGDGTIYAAGDKLYALTPSGKVKWSYVPKPGTEPGADSVTGPGEPCTDSDGTIYFVTRKPKDADVIALNSDGTLKWSRRMKGSNNYKSPSIGPNGGLYVSTELGKVYVFSK